jgi:hypothetical protein
MDYIMRQYISKCRECKHASSSQEYKGVFDLDSEPIKWYCNYSSKFFIPNENDIPDNCPLIYKGEIKWKN